MIGTGTRSSRAALVSCVAFALSLSLPAAFTQADETGPSSKHDGHSSAIRSHQLNSPFQAGDTTVRVLLPDQLDRSRQYRVLYVLPVVAGAERRFGDGLQQIRNHGLQNEHRLICVAPEFTAAPWFADHDSDPKKRDESHLLKTVLPFVEQSYPALPQAQGRLLIGFSKSGWGAISLLLRNPQTFHRAAAWDTGIRIDMGPITDQERSARIARDFGSRENFEQYRLSASLRRRGHLLGEEPRLFYYNTEGKRAMGGAALHRLMVELNIRHRYVLEPQRRHRWDSGWIPEAVQFLVTDQ